MSNIIHEKRYLLDGLDCVTCASNIEKDVAKLNLVEDSNVDFVSKTLILKSSPQDENALFESVQNIAKIHDSDIVVTTIDNTVSLYLNGLDCADCISKIENGIKKIDGIKNVNINFVMQTVSLEAYDVTLLPSLARAASKVILEIEPDVTISYKKIVSSDNSEKRKEKMSNIGLILGASIFIIGMIFDFTAGMNFAIFLAAYLLVGGKVLFKAVRNITKGKVFDENFLMSIATIGAFSIKQYPEGVAVMLFYRVGEFFQSLAVNRSRKSITALMDIKPEYANLKTGDTSTKVTPEAVGIGEIIFIKPGEKVPLDGIVIEGSSMLDTGALTGESLLKEVGIGDEILSGSINKNALLIVKVTKNFTNSTISKILNLVQNASSKKSQTENFITKFARVYTPIVVLLALLLATIPPLIIDGALFETWIYRALVFLVISCPCALVISIPLGFFGGIGGASKNGILIKGSNYLEALNNVSTIVFDKTGTLTKGIFKVLKIESKNGFDEKDLLFYAAHGERYSTHPIALSIQKAFGKETNESLIKNHEEISGFGVKANINGKDILIGNERHLNAANIKYEKNDEVGTLVFIAIDNKFAGYIVIADELKDDAKDAIKELRKLGIKNQIMLTGDMKSVGEKVAKELLLDYVYSELLPDQKVAQLEKIDEQKKKNSNLIFVGDGINDAPSLARADIGIAMGGLGSDAAIEAADIVIMNDEPSKIATAIKIAKRTRKIVWQNIMLALAVKAVLLVLGAIGVATMWEAVFGDVGVTIVAVLNSMRAMQKI